MLTIIELVAQKYSLCASREAQRLYFCVTSSIIFLLTKNI